MKKKAKKAKKENKYSYKKFYNDYKWLHAVLICIMTLILISTFIMIVVFSNGFKDFTLLKDFGGWTSLISGLLVFIGSTFLALVVFYNTWQRQKKEDALNDVLFKASARYYATNGNLIIPYTKDQVDAHCKEFGTWGHIGVSDELMKEEASYIQIKFENMQFKYPMFFKYVGAYCLNEKGKMKKIPTLFKATHSFTTPIEYREQAWCYVGVFNKHISRESRILVNKNKCVFYVFNFRNSYGDDRFYFIQSKNFCGFIDEASPYISRDEYNKSIREHDSPFGRFKKMFETVAELIEKDIRKN